MKRRRPTSAEMIACLLHKLWEAQGIPVPWEQQKMLEPWMTCMLVEWHHTTPYALCGHSHSTVIEPLLYTEHRKRTAEIDIPRLAKVRRMARGKRPGRPIPGSKRSIWRKRLNGKVERRG